MYFHQYLIGYDRVLVNHVRERQRESGLIIPVHIGTCKADIPRPTDSPIRLPLPSEIVEYGSKIDDQPGQVSITPREDIKCADLDEFKSKGIDLLKSLSGKLGGLLNLELTLTAVEENDASCQLGSCDSSMTESAKTFKHYLAIPDEIEAMEAISKTSVGPPEESMPSQQEAFSTTYL